MKTKPLRLIVLVLVILIVGYYASVRAIDWVVTDTTNHRSLPNMMALTAAIERFRTEHGRLPTQEEFQRLPPDPAFQTGPLPLSPEHYTDFTSPDHVAGEVTDARKRPLLYELIDGGFVIRSVGRDPASASDDFIYNPANDRR